METPPQPSGGREHDGATRVRESGAERRDPARPRKCLSEPEQSEAADEEQDAAADGDQQATRDGIKRLVGRPLAPEAPEDGASEVAKARRGDEEREEEDCRHSPPPEGRFNVT